MLLPIGMLTSNFKASLLGLGLTPVLKKRMKDIIVLAAGGAVTFCGIGLYMNNDTFYDSVVMPAFHQLDPEASHKLGTLMTKYKLVPYSHQYTSKFMESKVLGITFPNPIGVAAGYDKNGEAVEGLLRMGFGFVEVGSVTPKPQPGNAKPRVFRLPELGGIINRYGFNSDGHEVVFERLSKLGPPGRRKGIVGINLGKNKDSEDPVDDYIKGVRKFGPIADYLVINVSSPNTPGLRKLQQKESLESLTEAVIKERDNLPDHKPPILLKISPDLSDQDKKEIAQTILKDKHRVDGLIISNTTVTRPCDFDCEHIKETGGLSGRPLKSLSTSIIEDFARLTKGKVPIIGVGGVECGADAKDKIYKGASLVQLYSSLAFHGPPVVAKTINQLEHLLRKDGHTTLAEAVGSEVR